MGKGGREEEKQSEVKFVERIKGKERWGVGGRSKSVVRSFRGKNMQGTRTM